jgi:hypothetical protein
MERRSWADYTKGAAFELKQNSSWCGTRTATGTKPRFTLVVLPLPIRQLAWFLTEAFCTARPQERAGRANVLVQSMKSYLDRAARQVAEDEVGRAITGETSPFHSLTRQGRLYRARWIGPWQCAWSPAKTVRRLSSARALDSTWLLALPIAADVASKFSTTTYRSGQPDIARRDWKIRML